MKLWRSVKVTLVGADIEHTLRILSEHGVRLYGLQWQDELTVTLSCSVKDRRMIASICEKRGDCLKMSEQSGSVGYIRNLLHRPILTGALLLLFFLTVFLPTRVLFLQVEGNETIPDKKILDTVESCGIRFFYSRQKIRSEQVKNALLSAIPELQWAGINTSGCSAMISVKEREMQEEQTMFSGLASIVASADGYITSCTATKGNLLCQPGQIVREGQLLISGYSDLGSYIQVTQAQGEVHALTNHTFSAKMPSNLLTCRGYHSQKKRFSLILGKKRINLWKGSGISPVTCGRMYEEYYITLPGGFRLPVCLAIETVQDADISEETVLPQDAQKQLTDFAASSVLQGMVAGSILQKDVNFLQEKGYYKIQGSFFCSEMIGRIITEEIGETNGKDG